MGMKYQDRSTAVVPLNATVVSDADAAQYIEEMCVELETLADRAGLGFLAYLLEVAREEAMLHGEMQPPPQLAFHGERPPRV